MQNNDYSHQPYMKTFNILQNLTIIILFAQQINALAGRFAETANLKI